MLNFPGGHAPRPPLDSSTHSVPHTVLYARSSMSPPHSLTAVSAPVMASLTEHTHAKYGTCGDVYLKNSYYVKTNSYIDQSRPYVGGHKLTRYLYLPLGEWFFIVIALASISAPSNAVVAFIWLAFGVFYLIIFLQHMYVNMNTIPHVLQQPSIEDRYQQTDNAFYEITIEKYQLLFATSSDAGVGEFSASRVKIQVFTETAVRTIKICRILSTTGFFVCLLMIVYCFAWAIVRLLDPL